LDAAALNDSAVTDAADMLQQQLTLAGGEVEELEEVAAEEAVDWGALPGELLLQVLRDGLGWQREVSRAVRLVSHSWKEAHDSGCETVEVSWRVTDEGMQLVCTRLG
jgi:hypothetical protein